MSQRLFRILLLGWMLPMPCLLAQKASIRWLDFSQLEDSLSVNPKKVFIDFYADWCAFCRKMDQEAFRDPRVVEKLNREYYAVRMNTETSDTIHFGGEAYTNPGYGKKRNAVHEIPLMLASREGMPFTLPAVVILDASFRVRNRYFQYLSPDKMLAILD